MLKSVQVNQSVCLLLVFIVNTIINIIMMLHLAEYLSRQCLTFQTANHATPKRSYNQRYTVTIRLHVLSVSLCMSVYQSVSLFLHVCLSVSGSLF